MKAFAILLPATLAALLAGPAAVHAAAPSFASQGSVTMCTDPSFAPMEFFESAAQHVPVGYDSDLAHRLAKDWGVELRIITEDFTGLLPGLTAKRCDFIISGIFVTPARTKVFDAVPYLRSSMVILVGADNKDIHAPPDLAGKVVAIQSGTQYVLRAETLSKDLVKQGKKPLTIQTYPKETQVVEQLLTGRAAAAITQDTEAAYRSIAEPGKFVVAYDYPPTNSFGIYFRKNPTDVTLIEAEVAALRADGTIKALAARWHLPAADATAPLR